MDKFVKMYLRQDRETLQWIYSIQSNRFLDVIGEFNGEERALVLGQRLERDADESLSTLKARINLISSITTLYYLINTQSLPKLKC